MSYTNKQRETGKFKFQQPSSPTFRPSCVRSLMLSCNVAYFRTILCCFTCTCILNLRNPSTVNGMRRCNDYAGIYYMTSSKNKFIASVFFGGGEGGGANGACARPANPKPSSNLIYFTDKNFYDLLFYLQIRFSF